MATLRVGNQEWGRGARCVAGEKATWPGSPPAGVRDTADGPCSMSVSLDLEQDLLSELRLCLCAPLSVIGLGVKEACLEEEVCPLAAGLCSLTGCLRACT